MNFVFYLIRKNSHTGSLSNTEVIAFTDLLSTSHGRAKLLILLIKYWVCATKAGCTLPVVLYLLCTCISYIHVISPCKRLGMVDVVSKAEFADSSLPTVLINLVDVWMPHSQRRVY